MLQLRGSPCLTRLFREAAGLLSLRRYLGHSGLRAWSDPRRCGRRCPWSLTDSCMSRCRGYRPSTAGGRCINKHETNKVCEWRSARRLSAPYHSLVVAGVLESSDAGFTVWSVETFTALCNLRNTRTQTEALINYVFWFSQLSKLKLFTLFVRS